MKSTEPLTVTHPELCKEWSERNFPFLPEDETADSFDNVWWRGKCGHEWYAAVHNRALNGTGCPFCTGHRILSGFNDVATVCPELIPLWSPKNDIPLSSITCGSSRRLIWKCPNGHEWVTTVHNVRMNGCPMCFGKELVTGKNDLATVFPEVARQWSDRNLPLRPSDVYGKDKRQFWWKCNTCGIEYKAQITTQVHYKGGCPYCSGKKTFPGFNDLATTHPEIASEWDYSKNGSSSPKKVNGMSSQYAWWRCPHGHSWLGRIRDRTESGKVCPECSEAKP